jgi:hypothetical protein
MNGITITGQPDIDQATAEIAVALRDGRPGQRDQYYYDEAARLRDAIMTGTRALAKPPETAPLTGNPVNVYGGYSYDQLKAAFALVRPASDWKLPIDAIVPAETDTMAVHAAVEFFTGGQAEIVSRPNGTMRVTAPGYYACIGS